MHSTLAVAVVVLSAIASISHEASGQSVCAVNGSRGEKYSKSASVDSLYEKDMPVQDGGDWGGYALDCATNPFVIIGVGIVLFCTLCCINCANCKRLGNHKSHNCLVMPKCFAEGPWRKAAWLCLAVTVIVFFVAALYAISAEKNESDAIQNFPNELGVFADYLEANVLYSVQCIAQQLEYVKSNATDYQNAASTTPAEEAILDTIITDVNDILDDLVTDSLNSIQVTILDAVREIRGTKSDLEEYTTKASDYNSAVVYAVLIAIMLCTLCSLSITTGHGLSEQCRKSPKLTAYLNCCIILFMLLVFVVAAVYCYVLVFTAGFCYEPFESLDKAIGAESVSDQRLQYYVRCPLLTLAEEEAQWPWETERTNSETSFNDIQTGIQDLQDLSNAASAAYLTNLSSSVDVLGDTFTADDGVLGWQGIVGCGVIERYVEGLVIDFCSDWFNPTVLLLICFLMAAVMICVIQCVQKCLRRELTAEDRQFDHDDNAYNKFLTVNRTSPNAASSQAPFEHPPNSYRVTGSAGDHSNPVYMMDRGPPPAYTAPPTEPSNPHVV